MLVIGSVKNIVKNIINIIDLFRLSAVVIQVGLVGRILQKFLISYICLNLDNSQMDPSLLTP